MRKYSQPLVFNAFKPARITSFDVVRHFKKNLPKGYGKIGHFGTLDPFASGVLMIGVNGAAKLNDFIHEFLPKTYLAIGKLGVETATGDLTVAPAQVDNSDYAKTQIAKFDKIFIQNFLRTKFLGDYWQAPHQYSAAKHEGRPLHEWARAGVKIEKEKKLRTIYSLDVVKYHYPYLILRVQVSSGTYIRTLFQDAAHELGTIGSLVSLVREAVGPCSLQNIIAKKNWPSADNWDFEKYGLPIDQVLPFGSITFSAFEAKLYTNGVSLEKTRAKNLNPKGLSEKYFWVYNEEGKLLGLSVMEEGMIKTQFNLASNS
jgi:tRNA pseudouridine55 synthase